MTMVKPAPCCDISPLLCDKGGPYMAQIGCGVDSQTRQVIQLALLHFGGGKEPRDMPSSNK